MSAVLEWTGVAICAVVLGACICRTDLLKAGRHRPGWILLYFLWAPFAGGVLLDLLKGREVEWWVCAGVAGVLLQLHLTAKDWKAGPPDDLVKDGP